MAGLQSKFQNLNKKVNQMLTNGLTDGQTDRGTSSIHKLELLCNPAKKESKMILLIILLKERDSTNASITRNHRRTTATFCIRNNFWTQGIVFILKITIMFSKEASKWPCKIEIYMCWVWHSLLWMLLVILSKPLRHGCNACLEILISNATNRVWLQCHGCNVSHCTTVPQKYKCAQLLAVGSPM